MKLNLYLNESALSDSFSLKERVKYTDGTVIDLQSLQYKVQFLLNSKTSHCFLLFNPFL